MPTHRGRADNARKPGGSVGVHAVAMRPLLLLTLVAALGTGLYFLSEGRRLNAHNRHLQQRSDELQQRHDELQARHDELQQATRDLEGRELAASRRATELERELAGAIAERNNFNHVLAERVDEIVAQREARAEREATALRAMPEGVRLALAALNRCLAEDGFAQTRVLWAREIDGRELHGVELIEHDRASLATTLYLAERVTLQFDRGRGQLTAHLFDGHRLAGDGRTPFPAEGQALVFTDLDGPKWESRVGYLMEVVGAYPADEVEVAPSVGLAGRERELWLSRFTRLLRDAGTEVAYRVELVGDLRDAVFTDVLLLGYQDGRTLRLSMEAAEMQVVTDRRMGTVELVLRDGVLRKSGGETRITEQGYRILLPNVTHDRAMDLMMGMVVQLD